MCWRQHTRGCAVAAVAGWWCVCCDLGQLPPSPRGGVEAGALVRIWGDGDRYGVMLYLFFFLPTAPEDQPAVYWL